MATLITGKKLEEAVKKNRFFTEGLTTSVEGVKYDFRLGSRILKADYNRPIDIEEMTQTERRDMSINPGEIVFVLSQERLNLPKNITAILSPKRKLSHDGILTLGGLNVDPLYEGHLLFGLHNFSSTAFPLIPGKKLIAGMFYELNEEEDADFTKPDVILDDFPADLIRLISKYQPVRLDNIAKRMDEAFSEIKSLKTEITSDKQWRTTFQSGVESLHRSVEILKDSLQEEKDIRRSGHEEIIDRMRSVEDGQSKLGWHQDWLKYLIGGLIILVVTLVVQKLFGLI